MSAPSSRIPSATYRLQLSSDFRFADACDILDYLKDLGISDIYASPILRSRHGSGHGYDATDPTRIDPDLGSEEDFAHFQAELHNRGMGLLLDIVPNHMAASDENPWWMDVLEHGAESAYAPYFDINWHPMDRNLDGKILLPFLGKPFGETLDSGGLTLQFSDGSFFLRCFESKFPIAPRTYRHFLEDRTGALVNVTQENAAYYREYLGILSALHSYAENEIAVPDAIADRRLRFEAIRERLRSLADSSEQIRKFVEDNVAYFNGTPEEPRSFSPLERLLAEQNYRLAYWQSPNESINYRRFFTITDLVGIRVADPIVFEATHGAIFRWLRTDVFTGLRIDHIDGLRDPQAYLNKLQERVLRDESPIQSRKAYVVVEKILASGESLPASWPVSGTTGYDFLDAVNGLFVCAPNAAAIERIYADFTGRQSQFSDVLYQQKKNVMTTLLAVEMRSLGRELAQLAATDRYARELPRLSLLDALIEVTACLSVYRTYIRNLDVPSEARGYIERAVHDARERKPHLEPSCFEFVADVLLVAERSHLNPDQREARLTFVLWWQQFTGPIVAKGQEDTALYVYYPLLSLNEVGSDPQPSKASSAGDFVQFVRERQMNWPHSMNATTTHDTKRSEDVRARINVLSEIPDQWREHLETWAKCNAPFKKILNGRNVPDRNEEYFIYQTLTGIWPEGGEITDSLVERMQSYLIKATREAMVHTRWTRPNETHEQALKDFVAAILTSIEAADFRNDFHVFHNSIAYFGVLNGLSQTLLKIILPGVPDFYQGSELWDLRLVDPDNRQPVDFTNRKKLLACLEKEEPSHELARRLAANWRDPRMKLHLIRCALGFRRQHPDLLAQGEFIPIDAIGPQAHKIVSFARRCDDHWCLVAVPRWLAQGRNDAESMAQEWKETCLWMPHDAPAHWRNVLTGETVSNSQSDSKSLLELAKVFREFPVALLEARS